MTDTPLLLIGASGLAVEVAECARRLGRDVVGCLDDDPSLTGTLLRDRIPILGTSTSIGEHGAADVVVCVGKGTARRAIVDRLAGLGVGPDRYAAVIDPSVVVPEGSVVGEGTVLLAGVVVTAPILIGRHVVAMPHVTMTHDDVIGDFVTFAAGVALGGSVRVEEGAYLGMNSAVREGRIVGARATLGMGAVLLRDLPAGATWVGVPARPLEG